MYKYNLPPYVLVVYGILDLVKLIWSVVPILLMQVKVIIVVHYLLQIVDRAVRVGMRYKKKGNHSQQQSVLKDKL